jgi:hypothetical protein
MENAEHLKACIERSDEIYCDWTGSAYCGLKLDWDYEKRVVDLSMPGYIKADLQKFQHPYPTRSENEPHTRNPPVYGEIAQFIESLEDNPLLTPKDVTRIQKLAGTLLYYVRAIHPTLILPVNVLASEQNKAATSTADKVIKLLNYASYLSGCEAKSRAG